MGQALKTIWNALIETGMYGPVWKGSTQQRWRQPGSAPQQLNIMCSVGGSGAVIPCAGMRDDSALLLRYATAGCEKSFAELVRRYVDLVYAAAMRRTGGDIHRSAEIAQQVFTSVARNAAKLAKHPALAAWLHVATRNTAHKLMTAEQRRLNRESTAALDPAVNAHDDQVDWGAMQSVLDAAIDELPDKDRMAIVLRFLDRQPFASVAQALGTSEDGARMRTARALERLRHALGKRGIDSTAAACASALAAQTGAAAPTTLVGTITASSLAAAGGAAVVATASFIMTAKIITSATIIVGLAFWAGTAVSRHSSSSNSVQISRETSLQAQLDESKIEREKLATELRDLRAAHAFLERQAVAGVAVANVLPKAPPSYYRNAGQLAPMDAFETMIWASHESDTDALSKLIYFDEKGRAKARAVFDALSPEQRKEFKSVEELFAYMVAKDSLGHPPPTPTPELIGQLRLYPVRMGRMAILTPDMKIPANATPEYYETLRQFQHTEDGWKWVFPTPGIDSFAKMILSPSQNAQKK